MRVKLDKEVTRILEKFLEKSENSVEYKLGLRIVEAVKKLEREEENG